MRGDSEGNPLAKFLAKTAFPCDKRCVPLVSNLLTECLSTTIHESDGFSRGEIMRLTSFFKLPRDAMELVALAMLHDWCPDKALLQFYSGTGSGVSTGIRVNTKKPYASPFLSTIAPAVFSDESRDAAFGQGWIVETSHDPPGIVVAKNDSTLFMRALATTLACHPTADGVWGCILRPLLARNGVIDVETRTFKRVVRFRRDDTPHTEIPTPVLRREVYSARTYAQFINRMIGEVVSTVAGRGRPLGPAVSVTRRITDALGSRGGDILDFADSNLRVEFSKHIVERAYIVGVRDESNDVYYVGEAKTRDATRRVDERNFEVVDPVSVAQMCFVRASRTPFYTLLRSIVSLAEAVYKSDPFIAIGLCGLVLRCRGLAGSLPKPLRVEQMLPPRNRRRRRRGDVDDEGYDMVVQPYYDFVVPDADSIFDTAFLLYVRLCIALGLHARAAAMIRTAPMPMSMRDFMRGLRRHLMGLPPARRDDRDREDDDEVHLDDSGDEAPRKGVDVGVGDPAVQLIEARERFHKIAGSDRLWNPVRSAFRAVTQSLYPFYDYRGAASRAESGIPVVSIHVPSDEARADAADLLDVPIERRKEEGTRGGIPPLASRRRVTYTPPKHAAAAAADASSEVNDVWMFEDRIVAEEACVAAMYPEGVAGVELLAEPDPRNRMTRVVAVHDEASFVAGFSWLVFADVLTRVNVSGSVTIRGKLEPYDTVGWTSGSFSYEASIALDRERTRIGTMTRESFAILVAQNTSKLRTVPGPWSVVWKTRTTRDILALAYACPPSIIANIAITLFGSDGYTRMGPGFPDVTVWRYPRSRRATDFLTTLDTGVNSDTGLLPEHIEKALRIHSSLTDEKVRVFGHATDTIAFLEVKSAADSLSINQRYWIDLIQNQWAVPGVACGVIQLEDRT
jgi:hypothetical protein